MLYFPPWKTNYTKLVFSSTAPEQICDRTVQKRFFPYSHLLFLSHIRCPLTPCCNPFWASGFRHGKCSNITVTIYVIGHHLIVTQANGFRTPLLIILITLTMLQSKITLIADCSSARRHKFSMRLESHPRSGSIPGRLEWIPLLANQLAISFPIIPPYDSIQLSSVLAGRQRVRTRSSRSQLFNFTFFHSHRHLARWSLMLHPLFYSISSKRHHPSHPISWCNHHQ